jgi:endonuclease G, mitochondrial
MRTLVALLATAVFSTTAFAASPCDQMFAFGYPTQTTVQDTTKLCRINYYVEHDNTRKVPLYSAELLLKEYFSGKNKRVNAFKPDPDVEEGKRAELSDYDKRYDRGHMTPFEDTKYKSAASLQTFYLSNMVPQNLHLNRGLWRAIENRTRRFAFNRPQGVYVITGPVYAGKYKTIGNGVAVPTSIFKVVIDKKTKQGVGYIVPNTKPKAGVTPETYKVPISEVEKATGLNFTPSLKNDSFKTAIGEGFK